MLFFIFWVILYLSKELIYLIFIIGFDVGSGRLSWVDKDEEKIKRVALRRGDIYRLQPGSVFQIQSNLENERQKLRIYAIFTNTDNNFNVSMILLTAFSLSLSLF